MRLPLAVALIGAPNIAPVHTSLCVEEASTGFNWQDGRWVETTFATGNFLIRELGRSAAISDACFCLLEWQQSKAERTITEGSDITWGCCALHVVGDEATGAIPCKEYWSDDDLQTVDCSGGFVVFRGAPNGEFVKAQTDPIPGPRDAQQRDSLVLSHGQCSAIEP